MSSPVPPSLNFKMFAASLRCRTTKRRRSRRENSSPFTSMPSDISSSWLYTRTTRIDTICSIKWDQIIIVYTLGHFNGHRRNAGGFEYVLLCKSHISFYSSSIHMRLWYTWYGSCHGVSISTISVILIYSSIAILFSDSLISVTQELIQYLYFSCYKK